MSRANLLHYLSVFLLLIYTFVVLFGEIVLLPSKQASWCPASITTNSSTKQYENPDFRMDPCRFHKTIYLLFLTIDECDWARRILLSVIYGAIIGFERRSADRPAGIRTMSLVSLGSCFFTMCGMTAFKSSTMGWDAARVAASIPSGVGFLGAGLIWKGKVSGDGGSGSKHEVHGLATASGVWLSAAIGVGVGGRLYIPSAYAVVLVIILLRLEPGSFTPNDEVASPWSDKMDNRMHNIRDDERWERGKENGSQYPSTQTLTTGEQSGTDDSKDCIYARRNERVKSKEKDSDEIQESFNFYESRTLWHHSDDAYRRSFTGRVKRAKSETFLLLPISEDSSNGNIEPETSIKRNRSNSLPHIRSSGTAAGSILVFVD